MKGTKEVNNSNNNNNSNSILSIAPRKKKRTEEPPPPTQDITIRLTEMAIATTKKKTQTTPKKKRQSLLSSAAAEAKAAAAEAATKERLICCKCLTEYDSQHSIKLKDNPLVRCENCQRWCHIQRCGSRDRASKSFFCSHCQRLKNLAEKGSLSRQLRELTISSKKSLEARLKTKLVEKPPGFDDDDDDDGRPIYRQPGKEDGDYIPRSSDDPVDTYLTESDFTYAMATKLSPTYPAKRQDGDPTFEHLNQFIGLDKESSEQVIRSRYHAFIQYTESESLKALDNYTVNSNMPKMKEIVNFIEKAYPPQTVLETRMHLAKRTPINLQTMQPSMPTVLLYTGTSIPNIVHMFQLVGLGLAGRKENSMQTLLPLDPSYSLPPIATLSSEHCSSLRSAITAICQQYIQSSTKYARDLDASSAQDSVLQSESQLEESDVIDQSVEGTQNTQPTQTTGGGKAAPKGTRTTSIAEIERWYMHTHHLPLMQRTIDAFVKKTPPGELTTDKLDSLTVSRVTPMVIIENFEAWDASIIQDLLYLLHSYRSTVPFAVILSVSTTSDTVHTMLTHSITSLLSIRSIALHSQNYLFERFVHDTFVEDGLISFGPKVYRTLYESFKNSHLSMEVLQRQFRYAIKLHFFYNNLSFLCTDNLQLADHEFGSYILNSHRRANLVYGGAISEGDMPDVKIVGKPSPFISKDIDNDNVDEELSEVEDKCSEASPDWENAEILKNSSYVSSDDTDASLNSDGTESEDDDQFNLSISFYDRLTVTEAMRPPISDHEVPASDYRLDNLQTDHIVAIKNVASVQNFIATMVPKKERAWLDNNIHMRDVILSMMYNFFGFRFIRSTILRSYHAILQLVFPSIQFSEILYKVAIEDYNQFAYLKQELKKEDMINGIVNVVQGWIERLTLLTDLSNYPQRFRRLDDHIPANQKSKPHAKINTYLKTCRDIIHKFKNPGSDDEESAARIKHSNKSKQMMEDLKRARQKKNPYDGAQILLLDLLDKFMFDFIAFDMAKLPINEIFYCNEGDMVHQKYNIRFTMDIRREMLRSSEILKCVDQQCCGLKQNNQQSATNEDITIMFSLYSEFGRFINLHDWLTSFCMLFNGTGEHSPELQARFASSLDILQFLGLIQRTNRRTDHVIKVHCY
ncbi:hypothetical protein SAMD00019534_041450 [Acytostelium subglobosum LB1]|uniref:hypothetical protein n=1 Tax=Acytostelium subglobosum LB1 TaxID=1410327 RepID=UPI000644F8DC|nr:hypothetical protein SAMD00019534_041450 [Acytostelium subglobosum LB1]GAM20970.1 hypothetical protein SAMD00019534_041450 [Acytostelium subglobosum LB1]|eukprot:XP_012756104.1 hypothetical protein SAMD00019534_041450 [Acytostelium subglobosum LB1]